MIGGLEGSGLNVSAEILTKALCRTRYYVFGQIEYLCLAKILADFEMNNIAAVPPPEFRYNSDPCSIGSWHTR